MKRYILLLLGCSLLGSADLSAMSQARKDRGAGCTDNCTLTGKDYMSDTKLAGFDSHESKATTDANVMGTKLEQINSICSSKPEYNNTIGNVNWCEKNCSSKGGLLSRIKGRADKVSEALTKRKNQCRDIQETYTKFFGSIVTSDAATQTLSLKADAHERMQESGSALSTLAGSTPAEATPAD
ncbi:MAG: hypothetical protein ACTHJ4_03090 [Candidatus Nucleicultricaceae bacterium]